MDVKFLLVKRKRDEPHVGDRDGACEMDMD